MEPRSSGEHESSQRVLTRAIKRSQREVTILFTDIENSTEFWTSHGDVRGRLAIDLHNRIVFQQIARFRGKVIKTIGDSVMARFRKPEHALSAAAAIQQALAHERTNNPDFELRVRIGIHTGEALVERNDVFGNVVNAAARVEACATGNEILISGKTLRRLKKESFETFRITRGQPIRPHGQQRSLMLYRCYWAAMEPLAGDVDPESVMLPWQKLELALSAIIMLAGLFYLYHQYLRYFIADQELGALLFLNPTQLVIQHPWIAAILLVPVGVAARWLWAARWRPQKTLRLLRGWVGFTIAFVIAHQGAQLLPEDLWPTAEFGAAIYETQNEFVRVLEPTAEIMAEPARDAEVLETVRRGNLLHLVDRVERDEITWYRVLVAPEEHGWLPRDFPPEFGVPERHVTVTTKFHVHWYDLYALLIALIAFLWGTLNFRLSPA